MIGSYMGQLGDLFKHFVIAGGLGLAYWADATNNWSERRCLNFKC